MVASTAPPQEAVAPAKPATTQFRFRFGDEQNADSSDSDQSDADERLSSPSEMVTASNTTTTTTKKSKMSKKRDRRRIGALSDELGDLLGAAFQTPAADTNVAGGTDGDSEMQIEQPAPSKKMSKRKRQNLEKVEARKRLREQTKMMNSGVAPFVVERKGMKLQPAAGSAGHQHQPQQQQSAGQTKKNGTQSRRARKERSRRKKAVDLGDRMDIE